jgi:hypothetical protein
MQHRIAAACAICATLTGAAWGVGQIPHGKQQTARQSYEQGVCDALRASRPADAAFPLAVTLHHPDKPSTYFGCNTATEDHSFAPVDVSVQGIE